MVALHVRASRNIAAPKSDALCAPTSSFLLLLTGVLTVKSYLLHLTDAHTNYIKQYSLIKIMLLEMLALEHCSFNKYGLVSSLLGSEDKIMSKINMATSFLRLIIWWGGEKLNN